MGQEVILGSEGEGSSKVEQGPWYAGAPLSVSIHKEQTDSYYCMVLGKTEWDSTCKCILSITHTCYC